MMNIILCNSMDDVKKYYLFFLDYLVLNASWMIRKVYQTAYCIETIYKSRYIFVYYKSTYAFKQSNIIELDEFLDNLSKKGLLYVSNQK